MPHRNPRHHVVRARRQILRTRPRMRSRIPEQPRNIDDRNHLRSAACNEHPRLVGSDRNPEWPHRIALQLIQRNFHRLANIRAKQCQRVRECSAVLQMRQRHQVLGMQYGCHAQSSIGRKRHMKTMRDIRQHDAIRHHRARRINHRDLRCRRRPMRQLRSDTHASHTTCFRPEKR